VDLADLAAAPEREFDIGLAGTVQEDVLEVVRQVFVRRLEGDAEMRGDGPEHGFVIDVHPLAGAAPGLDGTVERLLGIGHDEMLIEYHLLAEAMADGTGAGGGIERKMLGRRRIEALAGGGRTHLVRVQRLYPFVGTASGRRLR